jgi:hypothetical protein
MAVVVSATTGCSRSLVDAADVVIETEGAASATGVSTVGDSAGIGAAKISSGRAGVPAAVRLLAATSGAEEMEARDSFAREVVASIPAIDRVGAVAVLLDAIVVPGIGLGSIAGLDSACAAMTAAASAEEGAGEPAIAGLCIQPRS